MIDPKIRQIAERVAASEGLELLDVEDPIPHRYTLEVSSPGAERKLSRPADFQRFTGKLAKVVLHEPLAGPQAAELAGQGAVRGRILSCTDGHLTLEVTGKGGATRPLEMELQNVSRAQLVLEW